MSPSCLCLSLILMLCHPSKAPRETCRSPPPFLFGIVKKILVLIYIHFLNQKRHFLIDAHNKYHMKFCEAEGSQVIKMRKLWSWKNEMFLCDLRTKHITLIEPCNCAFFICCSQETSGIATADLCKSYLSTI